MKLLFLHGWHSVPGGVKPSYLQAHGYDVINPKLNDDDFYQALRAAQDAFDAHKPRVVVGCSRGGAIAMNMETCDAKLVLLCPAWSKWGVTKSVRAGTIILHSRGDKKIPYNDSVELARESSATLIEVGADHRLADSQSLSVMLWACQLLATGDQLPLVDEEPYAQTKTRKNTRRPRNEGASYLCDSCGESIVVPLDLSEGSTQTYIEDCPVCCCPNIIHVHFDEYGNAALDAKAE